MFKVLRSSDSIMKRNRISKAFEKMYLLDRRLGTPFYELPVPNANTRVLKQCYKLYWYFSELVNKDGFSIFGR